MHGGGGGGGGGGTVRVGTVPLQALPTSGANRFIIFTKPCILLKPATVSQQVQALQPKLPNNNNNIATTNNNNSSSNKKEASSDSKPELLRCKRRTDLSSRLGLPKQQPASVARRNARERNRVKQVNLGFDTLRDHVPSGRKNKKLSKVDTLRSAVEYIKYLTGILTEDGGKPLPSLPSRDVSFASGESPDASSPQEDDQGFSDDGETAMLTEDSDAGAGGGVDENRCFPSPSLGDNVAPFSKDASEDVHHLESQDVENREPFTDSRHPPLGVSHLKQLGAAEEAGSFGGDEMCRVSDHVFQEYNVVPTKQEAFQDYGGLPAEQDVFQDYGGLPAKQEVFHEYGGVPVEHDVYQDLHPPAKQVFQDLLGVHAKRDIFQEYSGLPVKQEATDLAGLDAADFAQMVNLKHPPSSGSLPDSGLSSPVLTPLQNASLFLLSPPTKSFHSLNPLPRKSLSDAETNSSMLSPTSSVAASDHSSVAASDQEELSAEEQIRNISTWLHDYYPDSSPLTTGDDIFQIASEGR